MGHLKDALVYERHMTEKFNDPYHPQNGKWEYDTKGNIQLKCKCGSPAETVEKDGIVLGCHCRRCAIKHIENFKR